MNSFDVVVYIGLLFAMVIGFNTGLMRSAITILAYMISVPIAMTATSWLGPQIGDKLGPAAGSALSPAFGPVLAQSSMLFFGIFLLSGMLLGKTARIALDDATGSQANLADRVGGAALGAVRVGLIATTLVLVFDQLAPLGIQPAFLTGSQLRPMFSTAGQMGLRQLPPDLAATIVRLKQPQRS
jgi:membrane protein required for colicin V production